MPAKSVIHVHGIRMLGHLRQVVPVLLIAMAVTLAACSSGGSASPSTASTRPSASSSSNAGVGADSITIHNFAFSPATITVAPGTTVTVTNKDQVTHTLTASKGAFNTGDIASGQSKTFTAPKSPGTYAYICSIHQYMTGTVVVSA